MKKTKVVRVLKEKVTSPEKLIKKHKIKGSFKVKPGKGWFENAMTELDKGGK